MNTYSVKQIAEMLNTDPETVRRWIRTGKLEAIQESRKSGNVITEQMLQAFIKTSPKYAGTTADLFVNSLGLAVTAATFLGGIISHQYTKNEQIKNAQFKPEQIAKILKVDIASRKTSIMRKKEAINQLYREIAEEQQQIEEVNKLLNKTSGKEE